MAFLEPLIPVAEGLLSRVAGGAASKVASSVAEKGIGGMAKQAAGSLATKAVGAVSNAAANSFHPISNSAPASQPMDQPGFNNLSQAQFGGSV